MALRYPYYHLFWLTCINKTDFWGPFIYIHPILIWTHLYLYNLLFLLTYVHVCIHIYINLANSIVHNLGQYIATYFGSPVSIQPPIFAHLYLYNQLFWLFCIYITTYFGSLVSRKPTFRDPLSIYNLYGFDLIFAHICI